MNRTLTVVGVSVIALLAAAPALAETGSIAGTVKVLSGGKARSNRSGVVISVEGVKSAPSRMRAKVRQRNKTFVPGLTVVTKNSVVEFPNEDKIFHNVFSLSRPARFDLGLYKSGTSKSVKVRRKGEVTVYCNIHPEMVSTIKVVDTPFYAVTGKDGSFRIDGIPPGTYPITSWQAFGKGTKKMVTIRAGKTTTVEIGVEAGKKPKRHTRKDGTPYKRYE